MRSISSTTSPSGRVESTINAPNPLYASAAPLGQSIPDGSMGVDGYRALQRMYPDGVILESALPDFSKLERTADHVGPNGRQIMTIVSGGQTNIDQAALEVAENLHYERGGVVLKDRATASGRLDGRHPMTENRSSNVVDRTQHSLLSADGTLALHKGDEVDGTALTVFGPLRVGRPLVVASLNKLELIHSERVFLTGSKSIISDASMWEALGNLATITSLKRAIFRLRLKRSWKLC